MSKFRLSVKTFITPRSKLQTLHKAYKFLTDVNFAIHLSMFACSPIHLSVCPSVLSCLCDVGMKISPKNFTKEFQNDPNRPKDTTTIQQKLGTPLPSVFPFFVRYKVPQITVINFHLYLRKSTEPIQYYKA